VETVNDPGWTFHLLPEALTALDVKPRAVLHVGAHHGEEVPIYLACGFETITLVEADPANCLLMRGQDWAPQVRIYGVACGSEAAAAAPFYRNESTPFSSLTPNLRRGPVSTIEVPVVRTADVQDDANVLVIDTQGTEMDVLRAANPDRLELVIVEVQTLSPTAHGAYLPDLLTWANEHGWAPRIQWRRERRWSDMLLTPVAAP
jgi:FkbM family methyltransferase